MSYPVADPFSRRLRALTLAIITVLIVSHLLDWTDRALSREAAVPQPITPRGDLASDEKSTIELFERSRDAVVYISTSQQVMDFWSRNVFTLPRGTGSGFIWDDRGHVITNFHVVDGASEARVRLSDGKEYKAALVGASQMHDLAVLKISNGPKWHPLPVGTSHDLRVGQKVYAIGNPFGLDWTLTTGIVSALNRSLKTESGHMIEHLIQTDAAINPGNSGGPLLDSAGRLIGVNTAIYSPSGASAGVGFTVPVDTVNRVIPQLITRGTYVRPSLGIDTEPNLNRIFTAQLGVKGVMVLKVLPGSSGEAAGLRGTQVKSDGTYVPGDIITAIEGTPVDDPRKLLNRLDDFKVGESVNISILRNGKRLEFKVRLQSEEEANGSG